MADRLPVVAFAGGGALRARREGFGIVVQQHGASEHSFNTRDIRAFAIELLLLCEEAEAAWSRRQLEELLKENQ